MTQEEKTVSVLDRVTTKGNRSRFIDGAVLHYIETHGTSDQRGVGLFDITRAEVVYVPGAGLNTEVATAKLS